MRHSLSRSTTYINRNCADPEDDDKKSASDEKQTSDESAGDKHPSESENQIKDTDEDAESLSTSSVASKDEDVPTPSEKEETSQSTTSDGDDSDSKNGDDSQQQHSNNQTSSGIMYLTSPPTRPMPMQMVPQHGRYMMPPQQPPNNNKPPSLLSSILSVFFPRPQNLPPSPYGPPMPPSSPYGPSGAGNPILSLVIRLTLVTVGTIIWDFFHPHSDAFLPTPAQHYTFERINDRYKRDGSALRQALESPPPGIGKRRWKTVFRKRRNDAVSSLISTDEVQVDGNTQQLIEPPSIRNGGLYNRTVIIVDMKPDSRVGNGLAEQLRDTVSFLIQQHRDHQNKWQHANNAVPSTMLSSKRLPGFLRRASSSYNNHRTSEGIRSALGTEMDVVLFLDSPGGTVQDYGLASSHLSRLRNEPRVTLSVCVDRVAASGGYMMACQATPGHLYAAPFAMVGSIGVLMETVNVNEVLKRYGVKPLVLKAGKNKAPIKTLGEVTPEELQMAQDDLAVIHKAFQQWVVESRPNVVVSDDWIEKVCTGAVFLGKEAKELGLVDRVMTSDEYVAERIAAGDRVLRLIPYKGPQFGLKLSPLDLLLAGMDAKGRSTFRTRIQGLGSKMLRSIEPFLRAGAVVSILNHLASLQNQGPTFSCSWAA